MKPYNIQQAANFLLKHGIIIDTETTGVGDDDVVIELAAIEGHSGDVLIDTLVISRKEIPAEATKVHGISEDDFAKANDEGKDLYDIYNAMKQIKEIQISTGSVFTAYNLPFDSRLIDQSIMYDDDGFGGIELGMMGAVPNVPGICIMELANRALVAKHGEWDHQWSQFKRLSLERCLEIAGIQREGKAHRALSDCLSTRALLIWLSEGGYK